MSYYVSLGDIELDQVLTVAQSGERDISTYDSVGGGKFSVAQNKGLREWTVKCEINDHDLIDDLDNLQKRKTPVRLVISGGDYKISERVFLKSYSREEEYAGVFPTTLKLTEYVKAGVKTTSVPYVAREGTRVLPAVVTVGDGTGTTQTPFDIAKYVQDAAISAGEDAEIARQMSLNLIDARTGKAIENPADIEEGTSAIVKTEAEKWADEDKKWNEYYGTDTSLTEAIATGAKNVGNVIISAFKAFDKFMGNPYQ